MAEREGNLKSITKAKALVKVQNPVITNEINEIGKDCVAHFFMAEREGNSNSITKAKALVKVQNPVLTNEINEIGKDCVACFFMAERGQFQLDHQSESFGKGSESLM